MKTILHVIDTTGPGGAETIFIDLASRFPTDKFRSIVVIRGKGWVYEELCRRGIEPLIMDAKGSFNWRFLSGLVQLIRREGVDLIQSHLLGSNVYCSLAGLIARKPVVSTFHGVVDFSGKERLRGIKYGAINAGARSIIAVSKSLRDEMLENTSLSPAKIKLIYNGIKTADFQRPRSRILRDKFAWSDDDLVIGSLGNIRPAKGYDVLLRAAALLSRKNRQFRFVIAGQCNTSLYDDLLQLRKELGLEETVKFLGYIDDAADFLSNIDVFLSSSISEGLPLSAIQAMVAELPVVATRCGGYEELVTDRENGWLVEIGNPQAIADALETLAANTELRAALAEKAKSHAIATFDLEVMLAAYEKTYDGLLAD
jgi:glycosyltransferase involved in cell wall biosynthesis